jgi:hypothetical protein
MMKSGRITIDAFVLRFVPNAMLDHYESGEITSFDATELQIISPESLKGRTITLLHSQPLPPPSFLREPGTNLRFSIDEKNLGADQMLFDGAFEDLVELGTGNK